MNKPIKYYIDSTTTSGLGLLYTEYTEGEVIGVIYDTYEEMYEFISEFVNTELPSYLVKSTNVQLSELQELNTDLLFI
jgi:hypothetical protein